MNVLVTGAEGFVGGHLLRDLNRRGHTVSGTYLFTPGVSDDVTWFCCDLTEQAAVYALIEEVKPEAVIHLAAISHVPAAGSNYERAFRTNVTSLVYLLNAIAGETPDCRVISISSGEVYGQIAPEDLPVNEDRTARPRNMYGLTKECAERISLFFARERSLPVTVLRPFNQFGPGQEERFVTASFARQVARVKRGLSEPVIRVGNVAVKRDFTDVRDMTVAYRFAMEMDIGTGPFNVCSGRSISIERILKTLISIADVDVEIIVDSTRLRAVEISEMRGDAKRFTVATGWEPRITLETTLEDVFDQWMREPS